MAAGALPRMAELRYVFVCGDWVSERLGLEKKLETNDREEGLKDSIAAAHTPSVSSRDSDVTNW